ncbi:MAG TPA: efflux transporter outer membrane subunit [Rhodanobacteraceae bacterium]|nr:efflux transporter outer membrane subunit [Rhodanobacteraceae bacterium]
MTIRSIPARRALRPSLLFALCAALAACASAPVPPLPSGGLPTAWRNAAAEAKAPAPDLHGWWKAFGDPELNALVDQALRDNLDVQQAALHLRAARELEGVSGAAYKPQLAFRTLSTPTPQADADYFQAGFDAEWELGLFGRAQADRRVARGNADSAAADLQAARVSLVAEVARAYLQLRGAQAREKLFQDVAEASQRKLDLTQVRERLRLASQMDVDRAKADHAQAQAALAEPRTQIAQHAQTLALLLGRSEPPAQLFDSRPLPKFAEAGIGSVPADLLRTRPEIAHAQAQVLKAAGELGIAHADRFPRIGLGGAITWATRIRGVNFGGTNNTSGIGPVIDIPLFDWGMRAAAEHARDDELKAALLAYRQAILQGATEVEIALASLHQARIGAQQAADAATATQRNATASEKLRKLGQADDLDVADAKIAAARAQGDAEQARERADIAFVALYKALGGAPLPEAQP